MMSLKLLFHATNELLHRLHYSKKKYARILCLLKIYITSYDKRLESFGEFVLNHEIFSGNWIVGSITSHVGHNREDQ